MIEYLWHFLAGLVIFIATVASILLRSLDDFGLLRRSLTPETDFGIALGTQVRAELEAQLLADIDAELEADLEEELKAELATEMYAQLEMDQEVVAQEAEKEGEVSLWSESAHQVAVS